MEPRQRAAVVLASVAAAILSLGVPAGAGPDRLAIAEAAMTELTAALPGAFSAPINNRFADAPECDVAAEAEALATDPGHTIQQNYGLTNGGVSARIIIFDNAKDAKRYFKLTTGARARVCVLKTIEMSLALSPGGAPEEGLESELERKKLPGFKKTSAVFEGPITAGAEFSINEYEAFVRVGSVIVQAGAGETGTPTARDAVEQWAIDTAKSF